MSTAFTELGLFVALRHAVGGLKAVLIVAYGASCRNVRGALFAGSVLLIIILLLCIERLLLACSWSCVVALASMILISKQ